MSVVALQPARTRTVHSSFALDQIASDRARTTPAMGALLPDEVRILSLLAVCGPQPVLDLRDCPIASGRNAITNLAREAGVAALTNMPDYIAHLHRLGLVEISSEPLPDRRYETLDAEVHSHAAARHCSVKATAAGLRHHASLGAIDHAL